MSRARRVGAETSAKMKNRNGFTLVELIMVIAILSIVSTLAVNRIGAMREKAARRVSIANQQSIGRAVDTFLAMGGALNRLDNLIYANTGNDQEQSAYAKTSDRIVSLEEPEAGDGTIYFGPTDLGGLEENAVSEKNSGIHPELRKLLCIYRLNDTEAEVLRDQVGLKHVVRHYEKALGYPSFNGYAKGDDGSVPGASDGLDPNAAACITKAVSNGLAVAIVNPKTHLGRTIYQFCGEDYLSTKQWNETYSDAEVKAEVDAKGGLLIAFGLNDMASIVGNPSAGLDSVPYAGFIPGKYYSRYILLFRFRSSGSGSVSGTVAEFAGVLDPMGNTVRAARHALKE